MALPLHILMLEDSETDSEIVQRILKKDNPDYVFKLAMNKNEFLNDLDSFKPDLILADNSLFQFDAKEALTIVNNRSLDIPFILSASEIFIQVLTYPSHIDFLIRDNGVGFDSTKKSNGIGLTNIFNRAESFNGHAKIISEPGKGCTLEVEIPLGILAE